MRFMRCRLLRNIANIGSPELYSVLRVGTKRLVEEYIEAVVDALNLIAAETESRIPKLQKLAFFYETRHSYGRSALLFSGGSTLGLYHSGVTKARHTYFILKEIAILMHCFLRRLSKPVCYPRFVVLSCWRSSSQGTR